MTTGDKIAVRGLCIYQLKLARLKTFIEKIDKSLIVIGPNRMIKTSNPIYSLNQTSDLAALELATMNISQRQHNPRSRLVEFDRLDISDPIPRPGIVAVNFAYDVEPEHQHRSFPGKIRPTIASPAITKAKEKSCNYQETVNSRITISAVRTPE